LYPDVGRFLTDKRVCIRIKGIVHTQPSGPQLHRHNQASLSDSLTPSAHNAPAEFFRPIPATLPSSHHHHHYHYHHYPNRKHCPHLQISHLFGNRHSAGIFCMRFPLIQSRGSCATTGLNPSIRERSFNFFNNVLRFLAKHLWRKAEV
jgi:hypothetical protein